MKKAVIAILVLAVLFAAYVFLPGLAKNTAAYIGDYSVSDNGREMTLTVGTASSIGFIRKVSASPQEGRKLYLTCYSAFGGINGSLGAKTRYTIPLEEDTSSICIHRGGDRYEEVLTKDADGIWQRVPLLQEESPAVKESPATIESPLDYIFDTTDYDIDQDGNVETCTLSFGPTSGLFTVVFTVTCNGEIKYKNTFNLPTSGDLSFFADERGLMVLNRFGETEDTTYHPVTLDKGRIQLENFDGINYWGGKDWNLY